MKISTVERNGIKNEVIETISCLVARVPWPERRQATLSDILFRQGYQLRSVAKTRVQKKNEWTDPIFENVHAVNAAADSDPNTIRISVDTKATVHIGDFSRGGKSRGTESVKALDHEMMHKEKLLPGGVLETATGRAFLFFTSSNKTSDFLSDGIDLWWNSHKEDLGDVKCLVINMDNGPECNGHRSRFLQRMVEFADTTGLEVHLAYYPPYHSKYNSIEHYWGGLERSWNGYLLDSVETVLKRAGNFVWRAAKTTANLLTSVYKKGVTLRAKDKAELEKRLDRSSHLPSWDITIRPLMVK